MRREDILRVVASRLTSAGIPVNEEDLHDHLHIIDDLKGDDVDILDLVHTFEHQLNIELDEDKINTIGDLVRAILTTVSSS